MYLYLALIFLFFNFSARADVFWETHLIAINLPESDPDYDRNVKYKLYFDGWQTYEARLQKWAFVDGTLKLEKEIILFDKIELTIELQERDLQNDLVVVETILGKTSSGSILFKKPAEIGQPRYGSQRVTIKSPQFFYFFPGKEEKVFLPDGVWLESVNKKFGEFLPAIENVRQHSYEGKAPQGSPRKQEWALRATILGNNVRSILLDGGEVDSENFDFDLLETRGSAELVVSVGKTSAKSLELLDGNGKTIYSAVLPICENIW
jgi:hypothetical protein